MFLILLNYLDVKKVDELLTAHRTYLDRQYKLNKFICSGAQIPRNGGVILCNALDKDEVEHIILEDPFNINNAAAYEIIEFKPTKFASGFEMFI